MFTIMAYDVAADRVHKLHKLAAKYLHPVQNSLFQGYLSDRQLRLLKQEIARVVDTETDRVIFYKAFDDSTLQTDTLGICAEQEMIL